MVLKKILPIVAASAIWLSGAPASVAQAAVPDTVPMTAPAFAPEMAPMPMDSPNAADGFKVKLTYNKFCDTSGGKLIVSVPRQKPSGTFLCSGKMSWSKNGMKASAHFIFTRGPNWARVNFLEQLSNPVVHGDDRYVPHTVGYLRPSGGNADYRHFATYKWFNNRAASKLFMVVSFLRYLNGSKSSYYDQRSMPVLFRKVEKIKG